MSDHKETNPKDAAASTRIDLSLFPDSAVAYGALAFVEGDLKYGGYNWREAGVQASVYHAALKRHMAKWYSGEEVDPKTRVPHLANALACIAVLIDATEQGNMNDDRPPKQSTELYSRFEGIVAHLQTVFPRRAARFRAAGAPKAKPQTTGFRHKEGDCDYCDELYREERQTLPREPEPGREG